MRILIAVDPALAAGLAEQFETLQGFELIEAPARLSGIQPPWPDALVLDQTICRGEPAATIAQLREAGFNRDIILIVSDGGTYQGAAATLQRPFRFSGLVACIEAARARATAPLEPPAGVRLTEKEAAIFARLAEANGAIVSRAALLAEVWGYGPKVSTRTVETHICRLRRKLESASPGPRRLLTEEGGYRLEASVCNSESVTVVPAP